MSGEATIEIEAVMDMGVPTRILDLFTAQDRIPASFGFHAADGGMLLRLGAGAMPPERLAVLLARLRRLHGVHAVRERAALAVQAMT
jgi:hypothetical protein